MHLRSSTLVSDPGLRPIRGYFFALFFGAGTWAAIVAVAWLAVELGR